MGPNAQVARVRNADREPGMPAHEWGTRTSRMPAWRKCASLLALVSVTLKPAAAGCGACRRGRRRLPTATATPPLPTTTTKGQIPASRWAGLGIRTFRVSAWQSRVV